MVNSIAIGILIYILNHKKTTSKEIAERFEISTRTVFRYLDCFSLWGVPILTKSGNNGGIFIENSFELKNIFFTKEEIETLQSFCQNNLILFEKLEYLKMHKYSNK